MKLALIFPIILVAILKLNASVLEVCSSCEIKDISSAIAQSDNCDTIYIHEGNYLVENLIIYKSLSIIGINYPVIHSISGDEIFTILEDHCQVKGLQLRGVTTSYLKERSAIRIKNSKYFEISDNNIHHCFFGIYIEHSDYGLINNNTISGNATDEASSGNAIHAWYSDKLIIQDNILSGHRDGIYLEFVNESRISGNLSHFNKRYGLHFMFSNDDQYFENKFISNGVGVAVMFSRRINMIDNLFANNWGQASYGLLLKEIYDAEIFDNVFSKNTVGIFVEGSNRIKYYRNELIENGWAIKFSGGCESNTISSNNFIHNSHDLVVSSRILDNRIEANYWSQYNAYDLDRDGYGDVPYYPVKLFSYISNEVPETMLLMRSLFVQLINYTEKVSPIFTPKDVFDAKPIMHKISVKHNFNTND